MYHRLVLVVKTTRPTSGGCLHEINVVLVRRHNIVIQHVELIKPYKEHMLMKSMDTQITNKVHEHI